MKEEDDEIIRVGILLFEGVDLLGVAGSAEVFAATDNFEVFTVGLNKEPVVGQNLISILPAFSLEDCPAMEILVVPGGEIEPLLENHQLICWIRSCSIKVKYVLSVCKGATLLAKAGLLNKREVASFPTYEDLLQELAPLAIVMPHANLTDNGQVITVSGVSAGIDGALHLVSGIKGKRKAHQIADQIEYAHWKDS